MKMRGTREELQTALEDLVRRGVVEEIRDPNGETRFSFPDAETGRRLLRESRKGGSQ